HRQNRDRGGLNDVMGDRAQSPAQEARPAVGAPCLIPGRHRGRRAEQLSDGSRRHRALASTAAAFVGIRIMSTGTGAVRRTFSAGETGSPTRTRTTSASKGPAIFSTNGRIAAALSDPSNGTSTRSYMGPLPAALRPARPLSHCTLDAGGGRG